MAGRVLVIAQAQDPGWEALVDGTPLATATAANASLQTWAQGFAVGAEAAHVTVEFDDAQRQRWLWLQAALVAVVIVLMLPSRKSRDLDADSEADVPADLGVGA